MKTNDTTEPKPKVGMRVEVFNQIGKNWVGTIRRVGKKFLRIQADKLPSGSPAFIFTSHSDARTVNDEVDEFLVPPCDVLRLVK